MESLNLHLPIINIVMILNSYCVEKLEYFMEIFFGTL